MGAVNLALNKTVTATSTWAPGGYEPIYLTNGILATDTGAGKSFFWAGTGNPPNDWVKIDLGQKYMINKIGFNFRPYSGDRYFKTVLLKFSDGTSQTITLSNRNADGVSGINVNSNIEYINLDAVLTSYVTIYPQTFYPGGVTYMGIGEVLINGCTLKFLIQDDINIKRSTNGTTLEQVGTIPYTSALFSSYGMDDLTKINSNVINMVNKNSYKISFKRFL